MTEPDQSSSDETAAEADFHAAIEKTLREFVADRRSVLALLGGDVMSFVDAAEQFAMGGKRVRPLFCRAGWRIAGGADGDPDLLSAAAALEWLQASALVHDDLMDGSDTRRGRPSVHRAFEALHRNEHRSGDPERFGQSVAVLMGDLHLSWATEMLTGAALAVGGQRGQAAITFLDLCKAEVVAGQLLDVAGQTRETLTVDEALTVVRFKSAKYTIERPLHIGAALAGADPTLIGQLSHVALPLGAAFQLRDDLLGVVGDPAITGKPAGDDLREGKRTVLIARALEALSPADQQRLLEAIGTDSGVETALNLVKRSGALAAVEADIEDFADQAAAAVDVLDPTAQAILEPLIRRATQRSK